MLKVLKFGGSSMADETQYAKVKAIVDADPDRKVVVVSAAGKRFKDDHKITDLLYLCHAHKKYGVSCDEIWKMICDRYISVRDALGLSTDIESEFAVLREKIDSGISEDELVSRGEYFSARLMADYLGFEFVDAAVWLKFNLDGSVNEDESYQTLKKIVGGHKVVIPGFYGVMPDGAIKTFTRGGSDISGALAAAALDADVYENWTDVSGFLMADPRIVDNPETIKQITYSELRELSYIGAQVLHEQTIFPVREKKIALNIRNTNQPDHPGTMIRESFAEQEAEDNRFITGIAGKKNFSIINISKSGMSSELGIVRKIIKIVEKYGVNVEYMPNGIDTVSMVVDSVKASKCLYQMLGEIQEEFNPEKIHVTENIGIVAAVGRKMASKAGVSGKIFARLGEHGINIRMITQGPDEMNIIVGVDNKDYDNTIRVLYDSFVK